MARHQFSVPSSTHDGKKTRKEKKAELKANIEKFGNPQESVMTQQAPLEEQPLIDTAEDQEQMKKLITWGGIISIALLALMYFIFVF